MGWGCTAAISAKIDKKDLSELLMKDQKIDSLFNEVIEFLNNHSVIIPNKISKPVFFEGLSFYRQFVGSRMTYETIREHIMDDEYYISRPTEAFEFLVLMAYLSCMLLDSKIEIGIGDMSVFWLDLTFINGHLDSIEIHCENDLESLDDIDAFACSKEEINAFFSTPIMNRLKLI